MEISSIEAASVESVNDDVRPSTGRKGKRYLASNDELQPTSKKIYNLRNRKSKFSEEEVATCTPLSNRKPGKRLAESDSGIQVISKKSYYSRKKTSTLLEVSNKEEQSVTEEIEDLKEKVSSEEEQSAAGQIENMKEGLDSATDITFEETKEELVSEEEKLNVGEAIDGIKGNLNMAINIEDTKEEMGIQKGTECTDGKKLQNMVATMEPIAKACALNDEACNKEEQSVAEEIEDTKESLDPVTNIIFEKTKKELVFNKEEQSVTEEIEDMKEKFSNEEEKIVAKTIEDMKESLDSATNITFEEAKEELVSNKVEQSIAEEIEDTKEKVSNEEEQSLAEEIEDTKEKVSNEEEQSLTEEIEDTKESLDSAINITFEETKEEVVSNKEEQSVAKEFEDMKEKVYNEEEQSLAQEIEDMKESSDSATKEESKKGLVFNKEGQSVAKEFEDMKEKVYNEEEQSLAQEIEDMKESLDSATNITLEESKKGLYLKVCNKEEQSVAKEFEDMKEKVYNEEEQRHAQEIEDMKESLDSATDITLEESKKGLVSEEVNKSLEGEVGNGNTILLKCTTSFVEKSVPELDSKEIKEHINEETTDMEKPAAEVNTKIIVEEGNKYLSFAPVPKKALSTRSKILFMGNLPYSIDRQNVLNFFEDVGNVIDIRMAKNADGSMKGFCHVTFATAAAAVKVVKCNSDLALEKNGEMFHNRIVKLDLAENLRHKHVLHSTVLVRGLERGQSEEDICRSLMKHFEGCGNIKNIHVPKDIQAEDMKRVAFIKFEDSEAVSKAVKLCGSDLGNSKLFVKKVGRSRFRRKSSYAKRRNSRRQVTE